MNIHERVQAVEIAIQGRINWYRAELAEWCGIDTYSYYKPGLDRLAEKLAGRLRHLGMDVTIVEREQWGNDVLGVLHGDGGANVTLLGHIDTVYPVGTAAARPLRMKGNIAYGPGVIDMKGCLLSAIYAVEALIFTGYRSFGEIRFLGVSDEEISTRHCHDLFEQVFQNCQAVLSLEGARENGNLVSARKGLATYTLSARGVAAHAGVDIEKGRNAIVEIAHQITQFSCLGDYRDGITINPGIVSGGSVVNTVPDYAEVILDLRFLDHPDRLAIEAEWQKMMGRSMVPGVELTLTKFPDMKEPMVCTAESMRLIEQAKALAPTLGFTLGHELTGGVGDAGYASKAGLPALDGLGPVGGDDHSPGEYLNLESVPKRGALLAGMITSII